MQTRSVPDRIRQWWQHLTLPRTVPGAWRLERITAGFSPGDRLVAIVFLLVAMAGTGSLVYQVHATYLASIPAHGGTVVEGVVGSPRFVNPLLATSQADRDLTQLVYAGLMKPAAGGDLVPALAAQYTISEDGRTYTFTLRQNARFHDGAPVTAEDVVFTIERAQDPSVQSPKRPAWEGVTVEAVDRDTVRFTLDQPYAPFLENTTLGILPKHIWKDVPPEQFPFSSHNANPIGAGPYTIGSIKRNDAGVPQQYTLQPFEDYVLGTPYLQTLTLQFFANARQVRTAYQNGEIDHVNGVSAQTTLPSLSTESRTRSTTLPRVFAVFFNQNENDAFTSEAVRRALGDALDRERIVETVLAGYGTPLDGPLPPGFMSERNEVVRSVATSTATSAVPRIQAARDELRAAGWERGASGVFQKDDQTLSLQLATADQRELEQTARMVARTWRAVGVDVAVEVYGASDLSQNVIRPREYEALLFGQVIGRELDLYSFWHSSQRNDPGLNVAMYANITADNLLETTRATTAPAARAEALQSLEREIMQDYPAVFLYAPAFVYVTRDDLAGLSLDAIAHPSERFLSVHRWHLGSNRVWSPFVPERSAGDQ